MKPTELQWGASPGIQRISVLNGSTERRVIKVKCSDNKIYRVNPVYAFIEPGKVVNFDILCQNGTNKNDNIVFVVAKVGSFYLQNKRLLPLQFFLAST